MTYKATGLILEAVEAGRLIQRHPRRSRGEEKRHLYVTPQIFDALDGKDSHYFPMVEMDLNIARFCAGHLVTVSPSGKRKATFERLTGHVEVWAFCARKPLAQQVRMFGRFWEKNVFIGLGLYNRSSLGPWGNYNETASEMPKLWSDIIGDCDPFTARNPQGYLGDMVDDVDAQE